jgi:hypothetical protein
MASQMPGTHVGRISDGHNFWNGLANAPSKALKYWEKNF